MDGRCVRLMVAALVGSMLLGVGPTAEAQNEPTRSIEHIAGDVYYYHYDEGMRGGRSFLWNGLFMVTPEGIILVDPIGMDRETWLKEELKRRFDQDVKIIIYSHSHGDHAGGAEIYADTVEEIVAHENTPGHIVDDDLVSVMPTRTFAGRTTVELGGKTVELIEVGPGHTDDLVVARFPEERLIFVVDIFSGRQLPFGGINFDVPTFVSGLRRIEQMDFDIIAPGHTGLVTLADLVAYRSFVENLHAQVLVARRAGQTVDEMKQSITMDAYKDWLSYDVLMPLCIEGMNRYLEEAGY